jgi:uncharacterized membrane protein YoaK (UPF0700 family)
MASTTVTSSIVTTGKVASHRVAADRQPLWRQGLAASFVASLATTAMAAVASAAGVSFADHTGASIPVLGFANVTFVFSMLGVALAAVLARRARQPRRTFVRTTIVLLALSFIPDLTFGFDPASAVTLMATHVVAAAIVIPMLARRLAG